MRRKSRLSSDENDKDGEIFTNADCVDPNDRFYNMQISDKHGKGDIDEKLIAEVTGASEVLKKPKRRLMDDNGGEAVNIFEILQLFRESQGHRGGDPGARMANDPIQQLLLAAA